MTNPPPQVHLLSNLQSDTKPYYIYPHLKYQGLKTCMPNISQIRRATFFNLWNYSWV